MQYVPMGDSGFYVSRFGMGCMRVPQIEKKNGDKQVDSHESVLIIRYAIDKG